MSLEAKRISILKTELTAGVYPLTICDVKMHKKSNGDLILYEDNPAVIVYFKHEELIHQELYWIGSTNYTKLQKIIIQVGLDPAVQISKKEIVGKQFWGTIKEFNSMRGEQILKTEIKLTDSLEISKEKPNANDLIEYKQEQF